MYNYFESLEELIDELQLWMKELINLLYVEDHFDADNFENCLDEMCHLIQMKLPSTPLLVEKKISQDLHFEPLDLDKWKEWNANYLKKVI